MKFTYSAVKVQQTPASRPLYLMSCRAGEILKWCDIPRSKEDFMAGYQRELEGRHEKITEFILQDPQKNIIPSSIIVTVSDEYICVEEDASGSCAVSISTEDRNFEQNLDFAIAHFEQRLSAAEKDSVGLLGAQDLVSDEDQSDADDADPTVPPESYMAQLTKQLTDARNNIDDMSDENKRSLEDFVSGMSKPGLILDGQHRVFGAKDVSEFPFFLPVVLIPSLPPQEQVFHFYVLNNKAKPVDRTHLRRIVSTALSKKEIGNLYERFKQAGVETKSADWTHHMNHDSSSPFAGLVRQFKDGAGIIDENVAYQIVSKFMNIHKKAKFLVEGVTQWDAENYDYKLEMFYRLWNAVRETYPTAWAQAIDPSQNEDRKRQILHKVSMVNLQEYIIDTLNKDMPRNKMKGIPSPLSNGQTFEDECRLALPFLSEEFFMKEWKLKSLDTGVGHNVFRESINKAIQNQSKHLGNLRLFKG